MMNPFPEDFRVKLSNVGTNFFNSSFEIMKDTNALRLCYKVVKIITNEMAGEKSASLQFALACMILHFLDFPKEELQKNIDMVVKEMESGAWELKKAGEKK